MQQSVTRAKPVAHHAIHNEGSVDLAGRGKTLAAGQIAPFFRTDDAAGLKPLVARIHLRRNICPSSRRRANPRRLLYPLQHLLRKPVDQVEIGPHSLAHDLRGDVDHVRVAHVAAINHVGHLHPRLQLILLHLNRKDRHLGAFHIGQHRRRHIDQRPWGQVLEQKRIPLASARRKLLPDRGRNLLRRPVRNQGDFLRRIDAQAGSHRRLSSRRKLGRVGHLKKIGSGHDQWQLQ